MKKFTVLFGILLAAEPALATVNPVLVEIKVREMRLSPNADCSNSIRVFSNPAGTPQDFTQGPTLGTGVVPNGTYRCMLINMSDHVTYKPAATEGDCNASVEYTRDLFLAGTTSVSPDGVSIPGQGTDSFTNTVEDFPWAYFAIGGTLTGSCFDPNSKCPLSAAAVVTSDRNLTFVANFDGKIDGINYPGECELEPPDFSFR
jgi:hypothetical protein